MIEILLERWRRWRTDRRRRKFCFHHDMRTGVSYIKWQIIDQCRKMFWCTECKRVWIL